MYPNHMRADLSRGGWVVGLAGKSLRAVCAGHDGQAGSRLLSAMQVDEVMGLEDYYRAFAQKRAQRSGSAIGRVGDAVYDLENGRLARSPDSDEHTDVEVVAQDVRGDRDFIRKRRNTPPFRAGISGASVVYRPSFPSCFTPPKSASILMPRNKTSSPGNWGACASCGTRPWM